MSKRIFEKALAGTLVAAMVFGMSLSALAADETSGNTTGAGDFEGHVSKKVVAVTLPTNVAATTFAYKMDPEGLIPATNNAKYSGATFESGANVYFQSATNTYTKDSAKLKVINKGTADVDVTIKAEVADGGEVAMATSGTFATSNTNAELYLGLIVANKDAVAVKKTTDGGAAQTVGLKGKSDNFEITYDGTDGYGYTAKAGVPDTAWNSFEFGLTGACNPNGDYAAESLQDSSVTVTWSYEEHPATGGADMLTENATAEAAPSIAVTSYTLAADTPLAVNVNLGGGNLAATKVASVKSGSSTLPADAWSYADGVLTFTAARVNTLITAKVTRTYTVVFDDPAKTAVDITLDGSDTN